MWLNSEIRTHHVYNKPAYFKFRVGLLLVSGNFQNSSPLKR